MKFLVRYWYMILLAFALSLGSAVVSIYLQKDSLVVHVDPKLSAEEAASEIPGMSKEYVAWNYGLSQIEDLRVKLEQERQDVQKERQELDSYKRQIDAEAQELEALREEIIALRDSINTEFIKIQSTEENNLKRLSKVYSEMKPDAAVAIFSGLELNLVVKIISQMKEDAASKILAEMSSKDPDGPEARKAAEITEMIQRIM